ncbi:MAG: methionine adenosyltransferase [Candidatus Peregrinibacteria bacterium Greene1014_49]|nr:MAG: methionine adenosyltransferase [Candidatus Peregrinibacteria bacterium Greene1014_49]
MAKHIVKAGLAAKCEVQVAYAIGIAAPVSIRVDTFGTLKQAQGGKSLTDRSIEAAITKVFDLRPAVIIRDLELLRPQYKKLASYGHMGREDLGVAWEQTPRVEALLAALS